jgi:hypothetical protein
MLEGAPYLYRSRCMEAYNIEYWIDQSERIVLLGEAAHPWVVRHLETSRCVSDQSEPLRLFSKGLHIPQVWF